MSAATERPSYAPLELGCPYCGVARNEPCIPHGVQGPRRDEQGRIIPRAFPHIGREALAASLNEGREIPEEYQALVPDAAAQGETVGDDFLSLFE